VTLPFTLVRSEIFSAKSLECAYNRMLFQSNLEEEDIDKEIESNDSYRTHYLTAKMKISRIMHSSPEAGTTMITSNTTRTLKLPKLELPKFRGNVKDWLPFWSQFKKINDDSTISLEDKMQYL